MIPVEPTAEVPMPFDLSDQEPKTHSDSIAIAANTVDLISELGGSIDFDNNDLHKAANLIKGTNKPNSPRHVTSSAEARAAHAIIKEFDFQAFADAMQARNFITNKLIKIADCGDPKVELKALEMLGKLSDVGAFVERVEVNVTHRTTEELENELATKLAQYMGDIIDVESREVTQKFDPLPQAPAVQVIDIDEELGVVGGELDNPKSGSLEVVSPAGVLLPFCISDVAPTAADFGHDVGAVEVKVDSGDLVPTCLEDNLASRARQAAFSQQFEKAPLEPTLDPSVDKDLIELAYTGDS